MKRAEILKILSEELNPWTKDILPFGRVATRIKAAIDKTKVEPLAVLAKRKGVKLLELSWDNHNFTVYAQWPMTGTGEGVVPWQSWKGKTHTEAEAKAREWLEKQEDK